MSTTIERPKTRKLTAKVQKGSKELEARLKRVDQQADLLNKIRALEFRIAQLERKSQPFEKPVPKPGLILAELHDEKTGRVDAQKVADFMGISLASLSKGLGLNYKAVHRSPSANSSQKALRPVKRSLEILHQFFGPKEAIRAWLNTAHPDLEGTAALEAILQGKADAVQLILENAWHGVPV